MKLTSLKLQHFKNYHELSLSFSERLNCIVGLNGAGKTNLLDAIHYLAFTKGAFSSTDSQNIKEKEGYFMIRGNFTSEKDLDIICYQERNQKKIIKKDGAEYEKLSDHVGKIHLILHTPYDVEIIRGGSEFRRRWVDGCISQQDAEYLGSLINYQKVLRQRNALLKQCEGYLNSSNKTLLDMYDDQIAAGSLFLARKREEFIQEVQPYFMNNIHAIVSGRESSSISYKTNILGGDFKETLTNTREKDLALQRTTLGAHRDDYLFALNDKPIKNFGSQGQQKSFLIALRLTQYDYLFGKVGEKPILLLDDVFDKLDDERIAKLIDLLHDDSRFQQIFITDARKERTLQFFENSQDKYVIEIADGEANLI